MMTNTQPNLPALPEIVVDLGLVVATPGARDALDGDDVLTALARHATGDWGDVCDEDRAANDDALDTGRRLLSAYRTDSDVKFWVITEADRSVTTILLPEEY